MAEQNTEALVEKEIQTQKYDRENATKTWRDDTWFRQGFGIDRSNALLYFCNRGNPFYDKTCNNELYKMQSRDWSNLAETPGICYLFRYAKEPYLYVISKEIVYSKDNVHPISIYYIIGGTVYMAPSFHKALSARMYNCLELLNQTFHEIQSHATYSATTGTYHWDYESVEKELKNDLQTEQEKERLENLMRFRYVPETPPPYPEYIQKRAMDLIQSMTEETNKLIQQKQEAANKQW